MCSPCTFEKFASMRFCHNQVSIPKRETDTPAATSKEAAGVQMIHFPPRQALRKLCVGCNSGSVSGPQYGKNGHTGGSYSNPWRMVVPGHF